MKSSYFFIFVIYVFCKNLSFAPHFRIIFSTNHLNITFMNKNFTALLLFILLSLLFCQSAQSEGVTFTVDAIEYRGITSNDSCVSVYRGTNCNGIVSIPSTVGL